MGPSCQVSRHQVAVVAAQSLKGFSAPDCCSLSLPCTGSTWFNARAATVSEQSQSGTPAPLTLTLQKHAVPFSSCSFDQERLQLLTPADSYLKYSLESAFFFFTLPLTNNG